MLLNQLLTASTSIEKFDQTVFSTQMNHSVHFKVNHLIQGTGSYPSSDSPGSRKICFQTPDYTSLTTGGPAHKYNHRCLHVPFAPGPSAFHPNAPATGLSWVETYMFILPEVAIRNFIQLKSPPVWKELLMRLQGLPSGCEGSVSEFTPLFKINHLTLSRM